MDENVKPPFGDKSILIVLPVFVKPSPQIRLPAPLNCVHNCVSFPGDTVAPVAFVSYNTQPVELKVAPLSTNV